MKKIGWEKEITEILMELITSFNQKDEDTDFDFEFGVAVDHLMMVFDRKEEEAKKQERKRVIKEIKNFRANKDFKYWDYERVDNYLNGTDDILKLLSKN